MRWRPRDLAPTSLLVVLVIVVSACTDLRAVREWSTTSMEATQFYEIVATYTDTPDRLAFYDLDGAERWRQQATIREAQAQALELQLSLVAEYMRTLAALSADEAADFSGEINTLGTSLRNTGQVSDATLGAVGKLVTTLSNAAAQAWQKQKVGALVERANAPLQELLGGEMLAIVDRDFRRDLQIEAQFLDLHFEGLLKTGGGSATANAALNEWFIVRKAENARRMAAVDAYVGVLKRISEGHQRLYDGRNELDAVQLTKDLFRLAKEIRANVKQILKA